MYTGASTDTTTVAKVHMDLEKREEGGGYLKMRLGDFVVVRIGWSLPNGRFATEKVWEKRFIGLIQL